MNTIDRSIIITVKPNFLRLQREHALAGIKTSTFAVPGIDVTSRPNVQNISLKLYTSYIRRPKDSKVLLSKFLP